jgi:hypothetical protein
LLTRRPTLLAPAAKDPQLVQVEVLGGDFLGALPFTVHRCIVAGTSMLQIASSEQNLQYFISCLSIPALRAGQLQGLAPAQLAEVLAGWEAVKGNAVDSLAAILSTGASARDILLCNRCVAGRWHSSLPGAGTACQRPPGCRPSLCSSSAQAARCPASARAAPRRCPRRLRPGATGLLPRLLPPPAGSGRRWTTACSSGCPARTQQAA